MSRQDTGSTKGLTAEARQVLRQQPWPGNVRQLQKVVEAVWLRSRGPTIDAADVIEALHPWNGHSGESQGGLTPSALLDSLGAHGLKKVVEEYEKQLLAMLLNECKSLRAAARYAQLDLKTLRDKIAKFNLSQRLKA